MARHAHAVVLGAAVLGVLALAACNALSGASDLQFDEVPEPDATLPDSHVPPVDSSPPDAGHEDADGGNANVTCDASGLDAETVSGTATVGANLDAGTEMTVAWTITQGVDGGQPKALALIPELSETEWFVTTGYGFAITVPPNAMIQGFQVMVTHNAEVNDAIQDDAIELVQDGMPIGENKKSLTTYWAAGSQVAPYGSASDLWDAGWTAPNVQSTNFGVAISAVGRPLGNLPLDEKQARVTAVTVAVSFVRCPE